MPILETRRFPSSIRSARSTFGVWLLRCHVMSVAWLVVVVTVSLLDERAIAQKPPAQQFAIKVGRLKVAEGGAETLLAIQVTGTDALPPGSYVRIFGLPPATPISAGFALAPSLWAVPLQSVSNLRVSLPAGAKPETLLIFSIATIEGKVLAETKLTVAAAGSAAQLPSATAAPEAKIAAAEVQLETEHSQPSPAGQELPPPPEALPPAEEVQLTREQERALAFITRGQQQLADGNVSTARLLFQRAAEAGLAYGALFAGHTYDPYEITQLKVRGLAADPLAAREWYEKAFALGAPEAEASLRRLGVPGTKSSRSNPAGAHE